MKLKYLGYLRNFGDLFQGRYHYRWLSSIVLLLLVDYATYKAFSQSFGSQLFANQDKVLHFLAFAGLTVCGHISLHFDFFPNSAKRIWLNLANVLTWLGYGLFIEWVQKFLSYRSSSLSDFAADGAGVTVALIFVHITQLYPRRPEPHGES